MDLNLHDLVQYERGYDRADDLLPTKGKGRRTRYTVDSLGQRHTGHTAATNTTYITRNALFGVKSIAPSCDKSYISAHVLYEQHAYEFSFALADAPPPSALFALLCAGDGGSCAGDGGIALALVLGGSFAGDDGISWEETISSTPFSSNAALSAWSTYSLFPSLLVASTRRNHLAAARRVP